MAGIHFIDMTGGFEAALGVAIKAIRDDQGHELEDISIGKLEKPLVPPWQDALWRLWFELRRVLQFALPLALILGLVFLISVIVNSLTPITPTPTPPPAFCTVTSFQVTRAGGKSFLAKDTLTARSADVLLIQAVVSDCNISPNLYHWQATTGHFANVPDGSIAYVVPDTASDEITFMLPPNEGDEELSLTIQIRDR
jgi:hypothetical protein